MNNDLFQIRIIEYLKHIQFLENEQYYRERLEKYSNYGCVGECNICPFSDDCTYYDPDHSDDKKLDLSNPFINISVGLGVGLLQSILKSTGGGEDGKTETLSTTDRD